MFLTQEDIQKKVNDRIKEKLSTIALKFKVSTDWYPNALQALLQKSPIQLGMTAMEYGKVYHDVANFEIIDCYTFAGLNNEIAECTIGKLGLLSIKNYVDIQNLVEEYAAKWNAQTQEMRDAIIKEVMEEQMRKNNKPPNDKLPVHN